MLFSTQYCVVLDLLISWLLISPTVVLSEKRSPFSTTSSSVASERIVLNDAPVSHRSVGAANLAKLVSPPDPPPLETIEDVEMLSYFVMWNYYGRFRPLFTEEEENQEELESTNFYRINDKENDQEGSNHSYTGHSRQNENDEETHLNETLRFSEKSLHQFLEDLRSGKLDQRNRRTPEQPLNLDCSQVDTPLFKRLRAEFPGQLYLERMRALCRAATQCHSTDSILSLIRTPSPFIPSSVSLINSTSSSTFANSARPVNVSPTDEMRFSQSIVRLCPLILFQLQDQKCTAKREEDLNMNLPRPSAKSVWGFSFLFVTIISFCSLIGVTVLPFTSRSSYQSSLSLFEGLAAGSLMGSALFHLIPQSFNLVSGGDDYLWKALSIFGGIYLFFWSELLMKTITELRRRSKLQVRSEKSTTDCNGAATAAEDLLPKKVFFVPNGQPPRTDKNFLPRRMANPNNMQMTKSENSIDRHDSPSPDGPVEMSMEQLPGNHSTYNHNHSTNSNHQHHGHNYQNRQEDSPLCRWAETSPPPPTHGDAVPGQIATVAWMIIFGDGLHNFIDGLSIGAAFSESIMSGISVSVAVICEEFPHELGDFAVLLASGMSLRQAIGYNFLSACSCYVGMAIGILIGDLSQSASYVLALAGGMFIFISLSIVKSFLVHCSCIRTLKVIALQNLGILTGVGSLFLLAKYSEFIKFEGFAPPRIV